MQIENDYHKEVYNGDIGTIDDVDPDAGEVSVSFDGRSIKYGFGELDMLVPAYAATIHKSQGSETHRTAMAMAFFCPTSTTSASAHVSVRWPNELFGLLAGSILFGPIALWWSRR